MILEINEKKAGKQEEAAKDVCCVFNIVIIPMNVIEGGYKERVSHTESTRYDKINRKRISFILLLFSSGADGSKQC